MNPPYHLIPDTPRTFFSKGTNKVTEPDFDSLGVFKYEPES